MYKDLYLFSYDIPFKYVFAASEQIKKTAHWEVDVQVELFHATIGANRLVSGLFKGKTLLYFDLKHVVLKIVPMYLPQAEENMILVSSHIDTVFSTYASNLFVLFYTFFLLSYDTCHPPSMERYNSFCNRFGGYGNWRQGGSAPWALENFAAVSKYPSAQIFAQNDKLKLLKPGSLQHLGENILAFLLRTAMSSKLQKDMEPRGRRRN
ncbi:hypothetical protein ACMD2_24079 [Ananas comosus]|uniref:Uncharacterized protein n=1 Tax=Ananas comosus TaxID=4615 RepID=A0A199VXK6_ANACO|nr:hypothetical protein ACMD2_24079 [Ananas comosus]